MTQAAPSPGSNLQSVSEYLERADEHGLTWDLAKDLTDAAVEARLFSHVGRCEPSPRVAVDFAWIHRELRRNGVTLQLLWGEYQRAADQAGGRPYQYSQFCELYSSWCGSRRLSMRQTHRAGERLFVDNSGNKPQLADPNTGEIVDVELFVAVLGASNYTFDRRQLVLPVGDN